MTDWKDLALRVFWTAASAGLAFLGVQLANQPYGWVPVATAAVNAALVWVRQQVPPVGGVDRYVEAPAPDRR